MVQTNPDTSFSVDGVASILPKIYSFKWHGVTLKDGEGILQFNLTNSDLNILGDPPIADLRILGKSDTLWDEKSTSQGLKNLSLTTPLDNILTSFYTIGSNLKALDTVLSLTPNPNSADYNKFDPIEIVFRNDIDTASINKKNIFINGSNSGNKNFLTNFDSDTDILNLQITDELQAGETVTVTLTEL